LRAAGDSLTALTDVLPRARGLSRVARRAVMRKLGHVDGGEITLLDGDGVHRLGAVGAELRAVVHVDRPRFFRRLLFGGINGGCDAYVDGDWSCSDLVSMIRIANRSDSSVERIDGGWSTLSQKVAALWHRVRRNSRRGSRKNIAAHYDLGNDFFAAILDDTMTYSSGYFERPDMTQREASIARDDLICRRLKLRPSDHLLEIGTGWGHLAMHAAERYGCRVTTTTISRRQYEYARERIEQAGLSDRVRVLLKDYRDLEGTYDKLVSVEMIEAVGYEFFDTYFAQCNRLLRPGGSMLLQAITIDDDLFEGYRRRSDFIQRYIFPGGLLPSDHEIRRRVNHVTQLRIADRHDLTPHYARTLANWRSRLWHQWPRFAAAGRSRQFLRAWDFYFAYCEGGFHERRIEVGQYLLQK